MNLYRFSNKYHTALLLACLLVAFIPMHANAYVLHGRHVIDLMMKNFNKINSLLISQRMTLYHTGPEDKTVELSSILKYRFPEDFRSDTVSANSTRIHVISAGRILTAIDDKITLASENIFDYYKDIILYNSRLQLEKRLSMIGLDVTVSSIGHLKGKAAFVIGAHYPDLSVPQLWVDKQSFMPLRFILTNNVSQQAEIFLDIRYLEWKQWGKAWYPMRTEFYHNNVLLRIITVDSIEVNPLFSDDIFNIDQIKTHLKSNTPDLPEPENRLSDVQETIDEFKKIYE